MQEVALIAFGVLGRLLAGVSQCTERKPKAKRCVAYSLFRNLTQRQRCHDAKNDAGCHLFCYEVTQLNIIGIVRTKKRGIPCHSIMNKPHI
jgi:hypothetical protein